MKCLGRQYHLFSWHLANGSRPQEGDLMVAKSWEESSCCWLDSGLQEMNKVLLFLIVSKPVQDAFERTELRDCKQNITTLKNYTELHIGIYSLNIQFFVSYLRHQQTKVCILRWIWGESWVYF